MHACYMCSPGNLILAFAHVSANEHAEQVCEMRQQCVIAFVAPEIRAISKVKIVATCINGFMCYCSIALSLPTEHDAGVPHPIAMHQCFRRFLGYVR